MGILSRLEQRSYSPENPSVDIAQWIDRGMMQEPTKSGASVTEATALNMSAVWAAVRVRSRTLASMPIHVYQRQTRGRVDASSHPIYRLLHDRPNAYMTPYTFKETLEAHVSTWGNGYAEKERNGRGEVVALWPITPNRVMPKWATVGGGIVKVFEVSVDGVTRTLGADQVMHVPGPGFDGLVGYSRIAMARESLGLTKAAEEFGARMFGQGLRTSGVISSPNPITDKARPNILESINRYNQGLSASHRIMLLEEGLTWTPTSIPPDDAQFLETRKFQTVEVARWFEVPPHMIADLDRATFSNIEMQSIEFVTQTARPIVINWEGVLNWDLFTNADRKEYYAEFKMDALLRGDSASRGAYYTARFNIGTLSQNDIREMENENPIPGGDEYWVQGALVPISRVNDIIDAKMTAPTPPAAPAPDPAARAEPIGRYRPVLLDAAERILRHETDKLRAAMKKGNVESWADGFYYQELAGFAAKRFLPACLAADPENGVRLAGSMGSDWASASLAEVRSALKAGTALEEIVTRWEAERAEEWVRAVVTSPVATEIRGATIVHNHMPAVAVRGGDVNVSAPAVNVAPAEVNVTTPAVNVTSAPVHVRFDPEKKLRRVMVVKDADGKVIRSGEITEGKE